MESCKTCGYDHPIHQEKWLVLLKPMCQDDNIVFVQKTDRWLKPEKAQELNKITKLLCSKKIGISGFFSLGCLVCAR
jgi:hypothetical protein